MTTLSFVAWFHDCVLGGIHGGEGGGGKLPLRFTGGFTAAAGSAAAAAAWRCGGRMYCGAAVCATGGGLKGIAVDTGVGAGADGPGPLP